MKRWVFICIFIVLIELAFVSGYDSGNLLEYWKLNTNSGSTAYGEFGLYNGSIMTGSNWTTGYVDAGLNCSGRDSDSGIKFWGTDVNNELDCINNCSITLWAKIFNNSFDAELFNKFNAGDGHNLHHLNNNLIINMGNTSMTTYVGVITDRWIHIGYSKNDTDISLFINGSLVNYTTFGNNSAVNKILGIGASWSVYDELFGTLDEVSYWNESLSPNDMLSIFEDVTIKVGILNLTFSSSTNATLSSTNGGTNVTGITSLSANLSDFGEGIIMVDYGNNQLFSFYNDLRTNVIKYLEVITPDLVQKVQITSYGVGVDNALLNVYKQVSGTNQLIFSTYTDGNGEALTNLDDGNSYLFEVIADGYKDYSEVLYIPISNSETLVIDILSDDEALQPTLFTTNCNNILLKSTNCEFLASASEIKSNLTIFVDLNGTITAHQCLNTQFCHSTAYTISNSSFPVNSTLFIDGVEYAPSIYVTYDEITSRSIQIDFDVTTIRSSSLYLSLFYFMTLIFGIFIAFGIESKIHGWGLFSFIIWLGIIASVGFWEYWLVVIPLVLILIGRFYYEWLK